MKKYSELLTTAVASIMALSMLAGCGGETSAVSTGSATQSAGAVTFNIGAIGPLTGGAAA